MGRPRAATGALMGAGGVTRRGSGCRNGQRRAEQSAASPAGRSEPSLRVLARHQQRLDGHVTEASQPDPPRAVRLLGLGEERLAPHASRSERFFGGRRSSVRGRRRDAQMRHDPLPGVPQYGELYNRLCSAGPGVTRRGRVGRARRGGCGRPVVSRPVDKPAESAIVRLSNERIEPKTDPLRRFAFNAAEESPNAPRCL